MDAFRRFKRCGPTYVKALPVTLSYLRTDFRNRTGRMVAVSHFYRMIRPLNRNQQQQLLNVSHEFNNDNNFIPPLPVEENLDINAVNDDNDDDSFHTADLLLLSRQQRIILNHRYLGAKARMAAQIWNNFSGPTQRSWNKRAEALNKLPVPGKFMDMNTNKSTGAKLQQIMYGDTISFFKYTHKQLKRGYNTDRQIRNSSVFFVDQILLSLERLCM